MERPAPLRSGPALGSFYPSRTAQISTVLPGFFEVMGKRSGPIRLTTRHRRDDVAAVVPGHSI
jgi:hypothetical protein